MAVAIIITYILCLMNCIRGSILLNIGNGDTSDWTLMTCASSYCFNTTIFTFNGEKTCHNPLLSVHFRLTDFENADLQYLTIQLNEQKLGICTGPNNATYNANYNTSTMPLYTDCLNAFSVAELVGYNPTTITLQLRISPHVSNTQRAYHGELLYALVAFGCSEKQSNKATTQDWNPSSPIPAHSNLQCVESGCYAKARFTVLSPEQCRVPLLSLQFWLTDFDKVSEYLTVEVNEAYLGICQGGKQMELNPNILSIEQEDAYWNDYSYWCFRDVDISRYTGIEPEEIVIKLSIEDTVDRHWLDVLPTPYLLDAIVRIDCATQTQDDTVPNPMIYNRQTTSSNYPYPHEISIKCQEVECGAMWDWNILGQCPYPILSLFYATQHYDDSMIEININEHLLGHCGPTSDSGSDVSLSTQYGMHNVRTCFEDVELIELVGNTWNSRPDFDGNPDAIFNSFQFGFALTEIDVLDGIQNASVAHLFVNLDCKDQSNINDYEVVTISDDTTTSNGRPFGETELNCVYAGCSVTAVFVLNVDFVECEIPKLDLSFYLTDFGTQSEFLSIWINSHLYGYCDGAKDHDLDTIYTCLHDADIQEWADWDTNGNDLELSINTSNNVDALDSNKDGYLLYVIAELICYTKQEDTKIKEVDIYPNDETLKEQNVSIKCQGTGCYIHSMFYIREHMCYQATLTIAFWLSDFSTFDEYVDVFINGKELQKCQGGADTDFDHIWTCFEYQDIRHMLTRYSYNNDETNIEQYYIDIDDVLNVSLSMSPEALWLDHAKNHSILEGRVSLLCQATNHNTVITDDIDIGDLDNKTFRFIELTLLIQKVNSDTIVDYHDEIQSRFEYSLHATIHFEDEETENRDRIAFNIQSEVDIVDDATLSEMKIYITTFTHKDALEIKRIVELDLFLFLLQETLRDSHFSNSIVESITNVHIISSIPQTQPSVIRTKRPITVNTEHIDDDDDDEDGIAPNREWGSNENVFKVLFTSASATDWLSFIGVLVLSMIMCACCIGGIGLICVHHQRRKTRKEIQKYKQTKESDTDVDEMQGMMNGYSADAAAEHSVISHSFKSYFSNKSLSVDSHKKHIISEKIRAVNRANHLKDNIKRYQSHAHKTKNHKHKTYGNNDSDDDDDDHNDNNAIEIGVITSDPLSKSVAIHPALSTAIQTVNQMNGLKSEITANHGLVVSSAIMESGSESESPPSGIDLSEEFLTIDDISIDIEDIEDMNDINRRKKSQNMRNKKKFKNNKYTRIQEMDDDDDDDGDDESYSERHHRGDKVFGMRSLAEDKEQDQFSPNIQKKRTSATSDEDSDDLSELSAEQSLNSITHSFSQII